MKIKRNFLTGRGHTAKIKNRAEDSAVS